MVTKKNLWAHRLLGSKLYPYTPPTFKNAASIFRSKFKIKHRKMRLHCLIKKRTYQLKNWRVEYMTDFNSFLVVVLVKDCSLFTPFRWKWRFLKIKAALTYILEFFTEAEIFREQQKLQRDSNWKFVCFWYNFFSLLFISSR